ncbi:DUF2272 domain-containing protein [Lysobacter cavernae]|uniref:DUF2272 domain-containing protein n=1 Tax=Lysobacter cavernae TaxID=1685901 RepID=A0ABV7RIE8_9GAMM
MASRRLQWLALVVLVGCLVPQAAAAQVCSPASPLSVPDTYPARISAIACGENALWFTPFIDSAGRLASTTATEAEAARLKDGVTPAWRRVVEYWKGSGLLYQMAGFPGATECGYATDSSLQSASCRAFLIDNPWSAVFVSYVMGRAGVPGFRLSPSHIDYVRDAYLHADSSPFLFADPDTTAPATGDLLCFVRMRSTVFGYRGLKDFLDRSPGQSLNMHCDIVVATPQGGAGKLYLVGGNVLQGVTMRVLGLNRSGRLWSLPRHTGSASDCRPDNEAGCNFNRQDWAVLLKLKPMQALPMVPASTPAQLKCCVTCTLPMPPNVQRCASVRPVPEQ